MINNNKAQEEMVGFVMIMIVVAVIMLVFLAIWLRQDNTDTKTSSVEVSQFLDAFLEYTTDCARYDTSYLSVDELITLCRDERPCPAGIDEGKNTCDILHDTAKEIIESSWTFSNTSREKSYYFNITQENSGTFRELTSLGAYCTGTTRGDSKPRSSNIEIVLDICL